MYSVIIPAFNAEKYIEYCLNSLLIQSYQNFEIIIINDGSTDKTEEIVLNFHKENPRLRIVYKYQENNGPASARNNGILNSNGDLIAFLDADDFYDKSCLEVKDRFFSNHPEVKFVSTNAFIINSEKVKRTFKDVIKNDAYGNVNIDTLISENSIVTSTVVVKKIVFEDIGLFNEDQELLGVEDYELWLKIFSSGIEGSFIDLPLTFYREHPGSISADKTAMLKKVIKVLSEFSKTEKNRKYEKSVRQQIKCIGDVLNLEKFKKNILEKNYKQAFEEIPFLIHNDNFFKKYLYKFFLKFVPAMYRTYFCKKFIVKEF